MTSTTWPSSKANKSSSTAAAKRVDNQADSQTASDTPEPKRVKLGTDTSNKPANKVTDGSTSRHVYLTFNTVVKAAHPHDRAIEPSGTNSIELEKSETVSDTSTVSNDGSVSVAPLAPGPSVVGSGGKLADTQEVRTIVSTNKGQASSGKYRLVVGPSRLHVALLPRVRELSLSFGDSEPSLVIPFTLNDALNSSESKAHRIFNIAVHMEGFNMQNIFSADPRRFKYSTVGVKNDSRKIVNAKNNTNATFFTVGVVTESTLIGGKYGKEINVKPLARIWPRSHAVLSQLLKFNDVIVPMYKDGIQFSTFRKPAEGAREIKPRSVPMDGKTHGPPVRGWDTEVPIFRGLEPFKLTEYMKLDPIFNELEAGDYVLLAFTVGGYRTKDLNHASLNIQFAILLAKHDYTDNHDSSDTLPDDLIDETALGVDDPTPMVVPEGVLIDWVDSDAEYPDGPEF